MPVNILTKYFDLKNKKTDTNSKPRKTYKNKSKLIRKSRTNKRNTDNNEENTRKKRRSPIEILKKTPDTKSTREDLKKTLNNTRLRKSMKTAKNRRD